MRDLFFGLMLAQQACFGLSHLPSPSEDFIQAFLEASFKRSAQEIMVSGSSEFKAFTSVGL